MKAFTLAILLIASVASVAETQDVSFFCDSAEIPIVVVPRTTAVSIQARRFRSTDDVSTSRLFITNKSSEAVVRALAVVEYRDAKGGRIVSIVHYFRDDRLLDADMKSNFSGEERFARLVGGRTRDYLSPATQSYRRSIAPGKSTDIGGVTNSSALVCPTSATVTGLAVEFKGGRLVSDFAPGWHLDPEPRRPMPVAKDGGEKANFRLPEAARSLSATIQVDESGCPSVLDASADLDWVRTTLSKIPFLAARTDGKPVAEKILVLFAFHQRTGSVLRSWSEASRPAEKAAILNFWERDGSYLIPDLDYPHEPLNCAVQTSLVKPQ
jgi:hypothetical protein